MVDFEKLKESCNEIRGGMYKHREEKDLSECTVVGVEENVNTLKIKKDGSAILRSDRSKSIIDEVDDIYVREYGKHDYKMIVVDDGEGSELRLKQAW